MARLLLDEAQQNQAQVARPEEAAAAPPATAAKPTAAETAAAVATAATFAIDATVAVAARGRVMAGLTGVHRTLLAQTGRRGQPKIVFPNILNSNRLIERGNVISFVYICQQYLMTDL